MNDKQKIAQTVAEKFLKLGSQEKQFFLGYITGKRDEKEAKDTVCMNSKSSRAAS